MATEEVMELKKQLDEVHRQLADMRGELAKAKQMLARVERNSTHALAAVFPKPVAKHG